MTFVLELLLELGLELLLPLFGEVLVEFGFHSTAERIAAGRKNMILAGLAYAIFGVILGWLSLYLISAIEFGTGSAAFVYFVAGPLAAGFGLSLLSWAINRGIRPAKPFELAKFVFGVLFGMSFAFSRVLLGWEVAVESSL